MQLTNKRIIVTGGASGMGAMTVKAYTEAGANVASLDINDDDGRKVVEACNAADRLTYYHCDISDEISVKQVFATAVSSMGGLDVLVHCAGIAPMANPEDMDLDGWETLFAINTRSTFLTNKEAFTYMKNDGGQIINFGSAAGVRGLKMKAHYSASKGAVLAWTRAAAQAWGEYGITVNAIAPAISTPMYAKTRSEMTAEQLAEHDKMLRNEIPLGGKLGDPERDFAPVMCFYASDGARFITGQTIPIDGGAMMLS